MLAVRDHWGGGGGALGTIPFDVVESLYRRGRTGSGASPLLQEQTRVRDR